MYGISEMYGPVEQAEDEAIHGLQEGDSYS